MTSPNNAGGRKNKNNNFKDQLIAEFKDLLLQSEERMKQWYQGEIQIV